jgi:hypothetical protein
MCLGSVILPCLCTEIRDNHVYLGSAILPCTYTEIRDNHCGLGLVILPCTYVEIGDNHTCLGSGILLPFSLDCPLLIAPSAFSSGFFHNKYRFLNIDSTEWLLSNV